MKKPKVSIIIPVYNSKEFLERCILSLQSQTFNDWEAICIDDGSLDGSGEILDRFALEDSRIRVVHKTNEGVSAARNYGIQKAEGEYVIFVDSDDFLHPQTLEITVFHADSENVDLVAYTYDRGYRTKNIIRHFLGLGDSIVKYKRFDKKYIQSLVTEDIYSLATEYSKPKMAKGLQRWAVKHCQPWRCLYRLDTIREIRFPEGIIYEDLPWWGQVLKNVKKSVVLNLPLYFYYPNKWSFIFSSKEEYKVKCLRKAIELAQETYSNEANEYKRKCWEKNFLVPFREKLASKEKKINR